MITVCCNLCGQDDWRVRFPATFNGARLDVAAFRCTHSGYGHHAQIVECRRCGHVYANPRWSPEELMVAYAAVEDLTYLQEREGRELTFKKHLRALEQMSGAANGRSLLDIGAYIGVFVEVAQAAGWNAWGIEPSTWATSEAQQRGLSVIQGTLNTPVLQGKQFDVLTLWDVIEHLDDPSAELAKAYQLLKPGGWVVIHTMNVDSLMARLMRGRWPWFMDMHLHYFSQKTMAALLEKNGYEVVSWSSQGRYLRLGYLATRIGGVNHSLGRVATWGVNLFGLGQTAVPVNFGDLFTTYARRPAT